METNRYYFTVRVNCVTFNHAQFIANALDGFCMQETSFPFACVIVDDASTDGEQEIIKSYLIRNFDVDNKAIALEEETDDYKMVFVQHKTNKNCFFVVYYLKYNHFTAKKPKRPYFNKSIDSDYVAMCEGDDYWIDSHKLQFQVDFLESHPDNSGCIHAYRRDSYQKGDMVSTEVHKYPQTRESIPVEEVICGKRQFCATASWLYRSSAIEDYPDWASKAPVGDKPLKLVLFSKGAIGYIDQVMSVYRVGVPGSWTMRVFRDKKAEKRSREGQMKIMKDFDKWTKGKYHKYVRRNISYYRYVCWKNDFIIHPYLWLRKTLHI